MNKIFAIGFNKTGTTSLHLFFQSLGLRSYHGVEWRSCDNLELLSSYDCFSDGIPKDLQKLDNMFPNSKYILQVRDLDCWIFSRLAHIERNKLSGKFIKGNPEWDNTEFAIKSWIKRRNDHHKYVLSYFKNRPLDLLVINYIRDKYAVSKLVHFMGISKKIVNKPKANVSHWKEIPYEHKKMLANCSKELEITNIELKQDILCHSLLKPDEAKNYPFDTNHLISGY
jgi:hypothetical protein